MRADFGHPVAHTKLKLLRLKDGEDIGWCVRNARGARVFHRTVAETLREQEQVIIDAIFDRFDQSHLVSKWTEQKSKISDNH